MSSYPWLLLYPKTDNLLNSSFTANVSPKSLVIFGILSSLLSLRFSLKCVYTSLSYQFVFLCIPLLWMHFYILYLPFAFQLDSELTVYSLLKAFPIFLLVRIIYVKAFGNLFFMLIQPSCLSFRILTIGIVLAFHPNVLNLPEIQYIFQTFPARYFKPQHDMVPFPMEPISVHKSIPQS